MPFAFFDFRADLLDSVIFRTGIVAALRSKKLDGKVIGVMITASHNPAVVRPLVCTRTLLTKGHESLSARQGNDTNHASVTSDEKRT